MILTSTIQISASAEAVWRLLTDRDSFCSWHSGVRAVVSVSQGGLRAGSQFRLRYALRNKENNYLAEILEYEHPERLVIHLTGGNLPQRGYIQEIYLLAENPKGTLLTRQTMLENTGINIFSRIFLKAGHLFSRFAGKKYLSALKRLAEKES